MAMRQEGIGPELSRAMAARRMTCASLAREVGVLPARISEMRQGRVRWPMLPTADRLAEALDWPALSRLVIARRTKECRACGASFVDGSKELRAECCSLACSRSLRLARTRERIRTYSKHHSRIVTERLKRHQVAVAAFCRSCTDGDMKCRNDACELRPVSPLPFVPMRGLDGKRVA